MTTIHITAERTRIDFLFPHFKGFSRSCQFPHVPTNHPQHHLLAFGRQAQLRVGQRRFDDLNQHLTLPLRQSHHAFVEACSDRLGCEVGAPLALFRLEVGQTPTSFAAPYVLPTRAASRC
jgi:hypothetical protein